MKSKLAFLALLVLVNSAHGQWLPVTVNTNTGVYKPINIGTGISAGLTNAYSVGGSSNTAYVSGRSVVVQFDTSAVSSASASYTQQVYSVQSTNSFTTVNAEQWYDYTGMSVTVTPRTASSSYTASYSVTGVNSADHYLYSRLVYGSNVVGFAGATTNALTSINYAGAFGRYGANYKASIGGTHKLFASSTSNIVVRLQVAGGGANAVWTPAPVAGNFYGTMMAPAQLMITEDVVH